MLPWFEPEAAWPHYAFQDGCETRIVDGNPNRIKPELGSAFGPIFFPMDRSLPLLVVREARRSERPTGRLAGVDW